jgi:hypothetical protein
MRQFLEDATGLSIYPLISFLIFFTFFFGVLIWMKLQPKSYYTAMKQLPLTDETDALPTSTPADR